MSDTQEPDPYEVEQPPDAGPVSPAEGVQDSLFSSQVVDGVHVITFEESDVLDAYEIEQLGDAIYHHLETLDAPRVVIDLGTVEHLSSAALGMLIALRAVVEKDGGELCVANVSSDLLSIFRMTKLYKVINIYDSTEEALKSLH